MDRESDWMLAYAQETDRTGPRNGQYIYNSRQRPKRSYEPPERWTLFSDAHTNGVPMMDIEEVWVKGHRTEAIQKFIEEFGISPEKIDCHCCGERYNVYTRTLDEWEDSWLGTPDNPRKGAIVIE